MIGVIEDNDEFLNTINDRWTRVPIISILINSKKEKNKTSKEIIVYVLSYPATTTSGGSLCHGLINKLYYKFGSVQ